MRFCILPVTVFLPLLLYAQQYNYVQYNVKDGLAGSTVYDLCQDSEGFMWFATDAGVSRFDGTHFKNYTIDDGLPSNEILRVYADSKGRVWMAPFKKTICYYYKDKIYTQENDKVLGKIRLTDFVSWITEDGRGDIMLQAEGHLALLKNTGGISFDVINYYLENATHVNSDTHQEGFFIGISDTVFFLKNGQLQFFDIGLNSPPDKDEINLRFPNKKTMTIERKSGIINLEIKGSNLLFVNTDNGAWEMDTLAMTYKYLHLKGKTITHTFLDNEKNTWFTTLGHGVFKLISKQFIHYSLETAQEPEIYCLEKWKNAIVAGSTFSTLYYLENSSIEARSLIKYLRMPWLYPRRNRVFNVKNIGNKYLVIGLDAMLMNVDSNGKKTASWIPAIKTLAAINDTNVLVGTKYNVITVRASDLTILDTIWKERSTAVCFANNEYYVGTTDGCFLVSRDKSLIALSKQVPALQAHISQVIDGGNGIIWIATYGKGLIGLKDKKVMINLTTHNGLSSNICRALSLHQNTLWVGTDKGLNKIDISGSLYPIIHFTTADGLASNIINAIYADGSNIYVGSPAGITYFDESKVLPESGSTMKILSVRIGNKSMPIDSVYTISYKENSIKLDYTCISFRSEGDILYKYRLKGMTDDWDSTRSTSLEYASLPAGTFQFEITAINKFGLQSNPVIIRFVIDPPFWNTLWFRILAIAVIVGLVWALVMVQFNRFRQKEQEKSGIRQQLHELEQKALRAQMNPHFIFNCLSSIQSFIITKDFETTNNYLTEFARLIRQTLDNSEKTSISIENEVRYLSSYLAIEKMRYGNSFDYSIQVSPAVKQDFTYIPNMILQPYVENCIRHGLRHSDVQGLIQIKFQQTEDELVCIVEDNGIGRKKAAEYKSRIRIEYQSRGMRLTAERIELLNIKQDEKIKIEIIDLQHPDGEAAGTKIIIHFPTTILKKLV